MKINFNYLRPLKAKAVEAWYNEKFIKRDSLNVSVYNNATVLPSKIFSGDSILFGRGGVVDNNGQYVEESGIKGRIFKSYDFTNPIYRDEKVCYCGYLVPQWGHFLVEAVTRLWYFLKNDDTIDKYVFFIESDSAREIKGNFKEFLKLLGVWDKTLIINKPTSFREVVVPEMAFLMRKYWSQEYKDIFSVVTANAATSPEWESYDKIFLSRSRIKEYHYKEYNMDMLDEFFTKNGYKVICPEKISLSQLIFYFNHAKEIVTMSGSVQHNMMMAPDGIKHIIVEKTAVTVDFVIDICIMKNFDATYIDANLPIYHVDIGHGPFLMIYSGMLRKFAEDRKYLPADPKFEDSKRMRKFLRQYMIDYHNQYQYEWYMEDWEAKRFAETIWEANRDGNAYFKEYLMGIKPFYIHHYFQWRYIKFFLWRILNGTREKHS